MSYFHQLSNCCRIEPHPRKIVSGGPSRITHPPWASSRSFCLLQPPMELRAGFSYPASILNIPMMRHLILQICVSYVSEPRVMDHIREAIHHKPSSMESMILRQRERKSGVRFRGFLMRVFSNAVLVRRHGCRDESSDEGLSRRNQLVGKHGFEFLGKVPSATLASERAPVAT
jgi:hypothetical protein